MVRIATFGEIMLRLSPPGKELLFQSPRLEAVFGGGEANVAVSLAVFGHRSRWISVVPDNPVGEASTSPRPAPTPGRPRSSTTARAPGSPRPSRATSIGKRP